MSASLLVPIVEGHGEVEALPILIRRIFIELIQTIPPKINSPIRIKSGSFTNDPEYFSRHINAAAAKASQGQGKILIFLDCDDNCPATLGPALLERAQSVRGDIPCSVILINREYETWFLTAAESLRGSSGLPNDLSRPLDPESVRGAKEWLGRKMPHPYDPIIHQASFTSKFDLSAAMSCQSFARFVAKLQSA